MSIKAERAYDLLCGLINKLIEVEGIENQGDLILNIERTIDDIRAMHEESFEAECTLEKIKKITDFDFR
jgi:hypothetical protein